MTESELLKLHAISAALNAFGRDESHHFPLTAQREFVKIAMELASMAENEDTTMAEVKSLFDRLDELCKANLPHVTKAIGTEFRQILAALYQFAFPEYATIIKKHRKKK